MTCARHRKRRKRNGNFFRVSVTVLLSAGAGLMIGGWLGRSPQLPPAAAQFIPPSVGTVPPAVTGTRAVSVASRSQPVRLEIPAISVDAPVRATGTDASGGITLPPLHDHNLAVWYDRSAVPGHTGTAVILGHVDDYAGESVFFRLKKLVKGDKVTVSLADGTRERFSVDGTQKVSKTAFPASVYAPAPYPALRLVTCGGPFDAATGSYLDNIVVYAHLS